MKTFDGSGQFYSQGLTLIELLIAMVLSLFLMGGVIAVLLDSKDHFFMAEETSYIQENARFAVDQIGYDIRMAGYFGCSVGGNLTNTLNGSGSAGGGSYSSNGIKGFEYSERTDADFPADIESASNPVRALVAGTDVVVVNRGEQNDSLVVTSHTPPSATVHLSVSHNMQKGDILVMATPNCSNMSIFQMTGPTSPNPSHINHSKNNSMNPGNCKKALSTATGGGYTCGTASEPGNSETGVSFPPGSALMKFSSQAYFISTSEVTGLPTLFRMTLGTVGGEAANEVEELVSGVEDMEIVYGVDTDATADNLVNRYYTANEITVDLATAGSFVAWDRVLTARVTLILRSNTPVFPGNTTVNLGEGFTYNDRYMRQKVSSTVRLRNRGLGG